MRRYPTRDEIIQQEDDQNWTKEVVKEQSMSDTLQEREDEMTIGEINKRWCDECKGRPHAPWCSEYKEPVKESRCELHGGIIGCPCTNAKQWSPLDDEHEPAARSGGERIKVELINGVEGQCVAVNDYRICGPKPWGGGSIAQSWTTDKNDILRAFLTPDQKHAWLADELEVVSVNQHQALVAGLDALKGDSLALVAERERLRRMLANVIDTNYGTSYHHIGDGDGMPAEQAKEIADWWKAELERIQREYDQQRSTSE